MDLFIINLAWWISYYLRFESSLLPSDKNLFTLYFKFSVLITFLSYYYFRREGCYGSKRLSPLIEEIFSVIKANTFSFTIFILLSYFLADHKLSRIFIFSYYIISSILLISFKISLRNTLRFLRKKGKNLRHTVLIGNSAQIQKYADQIHANTEFGIIISKWFKTDTEISELTIAKIEELAPDSLVIGMENKSYHLINTLLHDLNKCLFQTVVLPDLSHSFVGYQVVNFSGTTAFLINEPNTRSRNVIAKRLFDLTLSLIGIVAISPLLILITLLIKLTSKGPIFYSQIRMGLDGRHFKMFKFRTMVTDHTNTGSWTVKNDPRVTPIGKILRKTSLDELPQLINVLLGNMSLVGPRPERPIFVHKFKHNIPTYMLRHKMKAGMTGWAQINGWRGDTCIEKRIECDLYYIKNWSIWMDLWIIVMTFWKGFISRNAY